MALDETWIFPKMGKKQGTVTHTWGGGLMARTLLPSALPGKLKVTKGRNVLQDVGIAREEAAQHLAAVSLTEEARAHLERVCGGLSLVADLHRSDMFIYVPEGNDRVVVYAHARPHSMASLYTTSQTGRRLSLQEVPEVQAVLHRRRFARGQRVVVADGAPLMVRAYRLAYGPLASSPAVLVIETNMMEYHRLRLRARVFRHALRWLLDMLMRGELANVGHIHPFGEVDGLILVDSRRYIRYVSGRGQGIYRRLGYLGDLVGKHLRELENDDNRLVIQAFTVRAPLETEVEERGRYLLKSVIPIHAHVPLRERFWLWLRDGWIWPSYGHVWQGALLIVRDVTAERQSEQELRTKSMLLREVHHRVKNNLQTIASLLRMQARRVHSEEAQRHLLMAATRVRAVADIHEFLQYQEGQSLVGMRDLCHQVWRHLSDAVLPPNVRVECRLEGPNVRLVGQQATAMALVVNELVLNAVEHGVKGQEGNIVIRILDMGPLVRLQVINPDDQLPADFDLDRDQGLGLAIVRTLVQNELDGTFALYSDERGVVAEVTFHKRSANHVK